MYIHFVEGKGRPVYNPLYGCPYLTNVLKWGRNICGLCRNSFHEEPMVVFRVCAFVQQTHVNTHHLTTNI